MGGYKGEIAEFTRIHGDVNKVNSNLSAELKKLRGNMEQTAGAWEGGAATAFRQLMERFDTNAAKLNDALADIGELLKTAGSGYEAQEEEHSQSINQLSNVLDG